MRMREIPREPHDRGRVELLEIGHDLAQMCVITLLKLVLNQLFSSDLRVSRPAFSHPCAMRRQHRKSARLSLAVANSFDLT